MSANVWFEEVNTALKQEIEDTVRYVNTNGVLTALDEDKAIIIRKPEEDLKFEVFPCVSIYNSTYGFEPRRYNPAPVVVGRNEQTKQVELEDPAVPFNLNYQIDFWSEYQTDMDTMTRTWLAKHFRQFNLDVIDDGGVKRSCNCLASRNVVKEDLVLNDSRLFHTIINLQIWVELDGETRYNMPMVVIRDLDARSNS